MSARSIHISQELANAIKRRRIELGLTIEEAAERAGVGTKTWCRYETGAAIRQDKYKGVCKALNWHSFPNESYPENADIEKLKLHEAWSKYIASQFGEDAAAAFVLGSDILLDDIQQDMQELASMPRGTHLGQISVSLLAESLPPQFLMRYDYDFLYAMYTELLHIRAAANNGNKFVLHSVLDELLVYLAIEEAGILVDDGSFSPVGDWDKWIYDVFGDEDIITFLYSNLYLSQNDEYHFDSWMTQQFYLK